MDFTVVHLVENLGLGGMERVVHSLVKMRHPKARVICTCSGGLIADAMRREGLAVEVLNLGGWIAVPSLWRRLRAMRPFILHTHGAVRAAGRLAGRMAGAEAVVHHIHGTEAYGWRQRLFERTLPADLYLACSQAVCDDFSRQIRRSHVEVLYNPVDVSVFREDSALRHKCRAALGLADDRPVIMTVGRFVEEKGQKILVQAAKEILSRHPKAVFIFVGEGTLKLEVQSEASDILESVLFLGVQEEMPPLLNASDIYVQPSVGREGLGVAALEAMACARPVIASRTQGLEEAVGDSGVLTPPGDFKALAEAVSSLLASRERRDDLGRRARERVVGQFSSDIISKRLESFYHDVLSRS